MNRQKKSQRDEVVKNDKIEIRPFISATASVGIKKGISLPINDWLWAKVDVMVTYPCYPEEGGDIFVQVSEWTDDLLQEEYDRLKKLKEDNSEEEDDD